MLAQGVILQGRCGKEEYGKPPYQAGGDYMNDYVNKMPVADIELIEIVIEGKCEKSKRTVPRIKTPPSFHIP